MGSFSHGYARRHRKSQGLHGVLDGEIIDNYPASLATLAKMKPVYQEFEGWTSDISHIRKFEDLPEAAQRYVKFIEEQTGVPVAMIGVGPGRDECILIKEML